MFSPLPEIERSKKRTKNAPKTHGRGNITVIETTMTRYDTSPRPGKKSSPNKDLFL
jgi:hypothetical protein